MDEETRRKVEQFARKNHERVGRGFTMLNVNRGKSDLLYFSREALKYPETEPFDGDFLRSRIDGYDPERAYLLVITTRTIRKGMDGVDAETMEMAFSDRAVAA